MTVVPLQVDRAYLDAGERAMPRATQRATPRAKQRTRACRVEGDSRTREREREREKREERVPQCTVIRGPWGLLLMGLLW